MVVAVVVAGKLIVAFHIGVMRELSGATGRN
jgi:hypothetical protein